MNNKIEIIKSLGVLEYIAGVPNQPYPPDRKLLNQANVL